MISRKYSRLFAPALTLFFLLGLALAGWIFVPNEYRFALSRILSDLIYIGWRDFLAFALFWGLLGLATWFFVSARLRPEPSGYKSADRFFRGTVSSRALNGEKGWVYILTNQSIPGLCKIGFTMHDPGERAAQLSSTGVATPFVVYWSLHTLYARQIEAQSHCILEHFRKTSNREFFALPGSRAKRAVLIAKREVFDAARASDIMLPNGDASSDQGGSVGDTSDDEARQSISAITPHVSTGQKAERPGSAVKDHGEPVWMQRSLMGSVFSRQSFRAAASRMPSLPTETGSTASSPDLAAQPMPRREPFLSSARASDSVETTFEPSLPDELHKCTSDLSIRSDFHGPAGPPGPSGMPASALASPTFDRLSVSSEPEPIGSDDSLPPASDPDEADDAFESAAAFYSSRT